MNVRLRRNGIVTAVLGFALTTVGAFTLAQPAAAQDQPGGANGSVKIDTKPVDSDPSNEPHVECGFTVQFFGFDQGTNGADVTFTAQPPSGDMTVVPATKGETSFQFEGEGPGNALNHTEEYELDTTGLTVSEEQGVHIKVDVKVTDAGGKVDFDKFKVFWVQPCADEEPTPTPTTTTPTEEPTPTPTATTPGTPGTPTPTATETPAPGPTGFDGGLDQAGTSGTSSSSNGFGWLALFVGVALLIAGLARFALPAYRNRASRSA